jgi:hypothetical protein
MKINVIPGDDRVDPRVLVALGPENTVRILET